MVYCLPTNFRELRKGEVRILGILGSSSSKDMQMGPKSKMGSPRLANSVFARLLRD